MVNEKTLMQEFCRSNVLLSPKWEKSEAQTKTEGAT
jgi:hypothetical protein